MSTKTNVTLLRSTYVKGKCLKSNFIFEISRNKTDISFSPILKDNPFRTSAFFRGGGVKNWPNLATDSSKKTAEGER